MMEQQPQPGRDCKYIEQDDYQHVERDYYHDFEKGEYQDLDLYQNLDQAEYAELEGELFREIHNHHHQRRHESNETPTTCLISRVDEPTRLVDPAEYDPQYVSIGPYHHHQINNSSLAGNAEKIASLEAVVRPANATALRPYLEYLDPSAMSCYFHTFPGMTSRVFVRMLLLDGCYILFRFVPSDNASPTTQPPYKHVPVEIERDVLYLLSNQIPFSVLEKIDTIARSNSARSNVRLVDVFSSYIKGVLEHQGYAVNVPAIPPGRRPSHLLHLLHMHFVERPREPDEAHDVATGDDSGKRVRRWRRATEYQMAGVSFKSRELKGGSTVTARSILDVQLGCSGATLMVPRLNVDKETWPILRNLTALEQGNPAALGSRVTAYCMFMSQVACTAEDVALLSRKGVVEHQMGDDAQCAKCFADLCKGVAFDVDDREQNYLWSTCRALDRRFRSRRSNWTAWLRRKYFRNPWLAIGLVSAAILLACAVVQSVYSVLSYYK